MAGSDMTAFCHFTICQITANQIQHNVSMSSNTASVRWTLLAVGIALLFLVWVFAFSTWRNRVVIQDAIQRTPGSVELTVGSCNQEPFVEELKETSPNTFEVLVRTRISTTGNDCQDMLVVDLPSIEEEAIIVDRVSGNEFSVAPLK